MLKNILLTSVDGMEAAVERKKEKAEAAAVAANNN